jgi:hypothetical protein
MRAMHLPNSPAIALALCLTACAVSSAGDRADPCADLLASPPDEWPMRLEAAYALGPAAGPRLVERLRTGAPAPGAPAAVALLGRLGGEPAIRFLDEQVQDRTDLAVEAALALGELHASGASATLRAAAQDQLADATLRTAAACALVRCGQPAVAAPLLQAVVLAGTPAGQESGRRLGLPVRPRWAHERYLVQRLLQQEGAAELAASFDTDSPWSTLEQVAPRIGAWLARRGSGDH